jgi:hypothetical protein
LSFDAWWKRRSGGAKTVTVLAALLMLKIGLCFSTGWTVQPVYEAIVRPRRDSEVELGLVFIEAILSGVTFVLLVVASIVVGVFGGFAKTTNSKGDSND